MNEWSQRTKLGLTPSFPTVHKDNQCCNQRDDHKCQYCQHHNPIRPVYQCNRRIVHNTAPIDEGKLAQGVILNYDNSQFANLNVMEIFRPDS